MRSRSFKDSNWGACRNHQFRLDADRDPVAFSLSSAFLSEPTSIRMAVYDMLALAGQKQFEGYFIFHLNNNVTEFSLSKSNRNDLMRS